MTFFGSTRGKFKHSLGVIGGPEGYLFGDLYYKVQLSYNAFSSVPDTDAMDRLNPSQLPNVRSDSLKYYTRRTLTLEEAYVQKEGALGNGWYGRVAAGYFEPAYGGVASQLLYAPVCAPWAIGVEGATLFKRNYSGLGFTTKIRRFDGFTPTFEHFVGRQYFLDLYYNIKPLNLDLKISAGRFLAGDKGARFELTRRYPSGLRFSIWYAVTNGGDVVNRKTYHDKGIAFCIPFDMFLPKSSQSSVGYAMSAWQRDVGARASTGRSMQPLRE